MAVANATCHSLFATRVSIAAPVSSPMCSTDHMLVLAVSHDDALGRAAGDPDALDRTADQRLPIR
jgi:hypothetical protein